MTEETKDKKEIYGTGSLKGGEYEVEDIFADAEPWSETETKMVAWSFAAALVALVIGGVLVNIYIL